jgi:hypothetical protein
VKTEKPKLRKVCSLPSRDSVGLWVSECSPSYQIGGYDQVMAAGQMLRAIVFGVQAQGWRKRLGKN